ncbi:hypothetical protein ACFQU2_13370 [Siccirubricoccus deserti]
MAIIVVISFSDSALLTFPPPGLSLRWYRSLAETPAWRDSILVSLQVMVLTAVAATALGTAAALGLASWRGPLAATIRSLLMAPLVIPTSFRARRSFCCSMHGAGSDRCRRWSSGILPSPSPMSWRPSARRWRRWTTA